MQRGFVDAAVFAKPSINSSCTSIGRHPHAGILSIASVCMKFVCRAHARACVIILSSVKSKNSITGCLKAEHVTFQMANRALAATVSAYSQTM